jgi:RHS repeat-associated protein
VTSLAHASGLGRAAYLAPQRLQPPAVTIAASAVPSGVPHHLRAQTADNVDNWSEWTTLFSLQYDHQPPLISDTIPADGSVITTSWPVISATLSDPQPGSGVQPLSTTLIIDSEVVTPQVNTAGGFAYTPSVRLAEGVHSVTAQVYDQAGNQTQSGPWSFTVVDDSAVSLGVTKYYMLGSQRIAMRQDDVVYFIHSDHLGSTSLTTDITGTVVAETRYLPYGEERWITGTLVTDFTFTGQRAERGFGLMDYNARYYDPGLGRFVSADSVVPQAGNPQAFNRYAYTMNNPVRHIDPSGHLVPPLNCWVCGLQIDISGWPGLAKRLASVVGFATDFHVDLEQGLITGPTEQEWIESSLTNMVNPIGMVSMPAAKAGKEVLEEGVERVIPRGFKNANEFAQFGTRLKEGLRNSGYEDVQAIFQGSSVTGEKFTTGAPFDVGRVSDFDIALASPDLLQRAKQIGVELRSKGTRTGPLKDVKHLKELGLYDLQRELSESAGRPVNFMIYESIEDAISRSPSILVRQ